jgi:hypothetical protein
MCWREEGMVEAGYLRVAAPETLPLRRCDTAVEKLARSPGGGTSGGSDDGDERAA